MAISEIPQSRSAKLPTLRCVCESSFGLHSVAALCLICCVVPATHSGHLIADTPSALDEGRAVAPGHQQDDQLKSTHHQTAQ